MYRYTSPDLETDLSFNLCLVKAGLCAVPRVPRLGSSAVFSGSKARDVSCAQRRRWLALTSLASRQSVLVFLLPELLMPIRQVRNGYYFEVWLFSSNKRNFYEPNVHTLKCTDRKCIFSF